MRKPSPQIIDSRTNAKWQTTDIIEPKALYVVCHDGKPFVLQWHDDLPQVTQYKYRQTTTHGIICVSPSWPLDPIVQGGSVHAMTVGPMIVQT